MTNRNIFLASLVCLGLFGSASPVFSATSNSSPNFKSNSEQTTDVAFGGGQRDDCYPNSKVYC